ncbi:MAG: hypothetical protein ACREQ2_16835 [Candidatus Binatia bacterium]
MGIMLLLLWSIPLALGLVALARAANGASMMSDSEWRLIFGQAKQTRLSVWMGIKFAVLAVIFFVIGLVHGAVLLNFGMAWIALASLLTASGAILLLVLWVRSGPSDSRRAHQHAVSGRIVDILSRKLSAYRGHFDRSRILGTSKRQKHR